MGCSSSKNDVPGGSNAKATKPKFANFSEFLRSGPEEIDLSSEGRDIALIPADKALDANDIPAGFWETKTCKKLTISKHAFRTFPSELWTWTQLEELEFSDGELTDIPAEISQLVNLKVLSVYRNKIVKVHANIGDLSQLEELNLFNNKIGPAAPPETLNKLKKLKVLNLGDNKFLQLPPLDQCESLEVLKIQWGSVARIQGSYLGLKNLNEIMANRCRLQAVPVLPTNIEKLDFNNNHITEFPEGFENCNMITEFGFNNCPIKKIPLNVFTEKLECIKCNECELTVIPEEIAKATNLTAIFFSGNQLSTLPECLKGLALLNRCDLQKNVFDENDRTTVGVISKLKTTVKDNGGKFWDLES